jgi:hypothetical protein
VVVAGLGVIATVGVAAVMVTVSPPEFAAE